MGLGIVFHAPEVIQDRNPHDLTRDFRDELPGYESNRRIAEILDKLDLPSGGDQVSKNMQKCYEALVDADIFPEKEMALVAAWLRDLQKLGC